MAALIGVHTDEELPAILKGDSIDLSDFTAHKLAAERREEKRCTYAAGDWWPTLYRRYTRWRETSFMLDPEVLGDCVRRNIGDVTFEEAYLRTNRVLNITVPPTGPGAYTLFNYLTAPRVLIWSAAMLSNVTDARDTPLRLLCKNRDGYIDIYSEPAAMPAPPMPFDQRPLQRLTEMLNINHYVVSQARPYLLPFLNPTSPRPRGQWAKTVWLWEYIFSEWNLRLRQLESILPPRIRRIIHDEMLPDLAASITIVPEVTWGDWIRLLRNPTAAEIDFWIRRGERSVWGLIQELEVRLPIEIAIDRAYHMVNRGDDVRLVERLQQEEREERNRRKVVPGTSRKRAVSFDD
jgi:TAG lipase/lysophosphatidylethanolamine acyltransferase